MQCSENSGGMNIPSAEIECTGSPKFYKARNVPFGQRDAVEAHLQTLQSEGILSRVQSSEWASPIVVIKKSNGQLRICGDYRVTVNQHIHQRATTTPEPDAIFSRVQGAQLFSKIDLKNAFLQIPLSAAASQLTVINTPFGLFKYNYLPFGLSCSPAIFQDAIDIIIKDLPNTVAYQDDILVYTSTAEQHHETLNTLLDRLITANVRLNSEITQIDETHLDSQTEQIV